MKLDELKATLDEWEGDALELDYKIASGEIPEFDNADAKMKVNLWFALQDALKQFAQLEAENEALREMVMYCLRGHYVTEESGNEAHEIFPEYSEMIDTLLTVEQGQVLDRS